MAYYAPFYRPTYYEPVQQNPMGQFNQQYQQPMSQPMQQAPMQTQPTNDFLWVLNENEATSYPVAPNNTVTVGQKPPYNLHQVRKCTGRSVYAYS